MNNLLLARVLFTVVLLLLMITAAGTVVIGLVLFPLLRSTFIMEEAAVKDQQQVCVNA